MQIKEEVLKKIENGELLKLDLGSGNKHKEGFIRVDKAEAVNPDILCNLDVDGIPLPDNCVEHIEAIAVLEHCTDVIFVLNEIWRVLIPCGTVHIVVPHPGWDLAYGDPTHKSFFSVDSVSYWDKRSIHYTNTDYGVKCMWNIKKVELEVSEAIRQIPQEQHQFAINHFRNLATHIHFVLEAEK